MMKKTKRKKRRAKRVTGDQRALMFICRDLRRRWLQYGENRNLDRGQCDNCERTAHKTEVDHIVPLGVRPYNWEDLGGYAKRMFEGECQALCKECHLTKTKEERKKRGKHEK